MWVFFTVMKKLWKYRGPSCSCPFVAVNLCVGLLFVSAFEMGKKLIKIVEDKVSQ